LVASIFPLSFWWRIRQPGKDPRRKHSTTQRPKLFTLVPTRNGASSKSDGTDSLPSDVDNGSVLRGSAYVALDSWIYFAVERLAARGYIHSQFLGHASLDPYRVCADVAAGRGAN
jgi:hypothetical protein